MEKTIESPAEMSRDQSKINPKVEVVEVQSKKQLTQFLNLPSEIYTDPTSPYVMPLEIHMKMMMGKLGVDQKHFFLAFVAGKPVARLGVKVHKHDSTTRLHWGFFECQPKYPEAAKALFDKAHGMYPHLSMMGPFHFRQEDPYIGILVKGFEYDPYFMMSYNPPSYDQIVQKAGHKTVMDLFTYDLSREEGCPELVVNNGKKAEKELGITYRQLDVKNLRSEAFKIAGIFNEALAQNWGFEEFVEDQIDEMIMMLKFFIDPRVVQFAMKDGKEIGCLLMIPNFNHVLKPSKGKIGLGLLMRYLKRKATTNSMRGYALGVLKAYQGKGIGSALTAKMFEVGTVAGYDKCEVSWVLANNSPMNDLAVAMGGKQRKVYRIYEKLALDNAMSH